MFEMYEMLQGQLRLFELIEKTRVPRVIARDRRDPFLCLTDEEFVQRYTLPKHVTRNLVEEIRPRAPKIKNGRGCSIPLLMQLLVTLRYMASGSFQMCMADDAEMSISSVCRCVGRISKLIAYLAPDYIKFPQPHEAKDQAHKFLKIAGIPGVIGCVDGSHVPIKSPGGDSAEYYRCRKGFYSLNVQGICDSDLRFINVVASWPGGVDDATIFDYSGVCSMFEQGNYEGLCLLGDSEYPCRDFLLTPVLNPTNEKEQYYNNAHVKTRNCIERAFGVLKKRFACLSTPLRTQLQTTKRIIMACAVLHNMAIESKIPLPDVEIVPQNNVEELQESAIDGDGDVQKRNSLIENCF